jgi:hypothetical protein
MKRKGLTIGLVLVVVGIWGAVFTKAIKPGSEEPIDPGIVNAVTRQVAALTDSLPNASSLGNYRDPFLRAEAPVRAVSTGDPKPVAVKKAAPVVPSPSFTWPQVAFKGMLKNTNNKQGVALVSINGKDKVLVEGKEEEHGIMLFAVARDSITLKAHGEQRRFGR